MNDSMLLGIYREQRFSPGKVEPDSAILDHALDLLASQGATVERIPAESLAGYRKRPRAVLTMAQAPEALARLERWQHAGITMINPVQGVRNCYRKRLVAVLDAARVEMPPSHLIRLAQLETLPLDDSNGGWWLKRGDVHAMRPGDVVRVRCARDLAQAIAHYRRHSIDEVLAQEHVEGRVVKFYGVGPGDYFVAFCARTGHELSAETGSKLAPVARRAAAALDLDIYGGDAIWTADDRLLLIDFNDWPSFSRCCQPAAQAIASYCIRKLEGGSVELSPSC